MVWKTSPNSSNSSNWTSLSPHSPPKPPGLIFSKFKTSLNPVITLILLEILASLFPQVSTYPNQIAAFGAGDLFVIMNKAQRLENLDSGTWRVTGVSDKADPVEWTVENDQFVRRIYNMKSQWIYLVHYLDSGRKSIPVSSNQVSSTQIPVVREIPPTQVTLQELRDTPTPPTRFSSLPRQPKSASASMPFQSSTLTGPLRTPAPISLHATFPGPASQASDRILYPSTFVSPPVPLPISSSAPTRLDTDSINRGLTNKQGSHNCFLNGVLQVLWHIRPFNDLILTLRHQCMDPISCFFCRLRALFAEYRSTDKITIPPDSIRDALHAIYHPEGKFQLWQMADAAECFEAIMNILHMLSQIEYGRSSDDCGDCAAHAVFGMEFVEETGCSSSRHFANEPTALREFVHYVPTFPIPGIQEALGTNNFERVMRHQLSQCDTSCQVCAGPMATQLTLLNHPKVLTLGLNWSSGDPPMQELDAVLTVLSPTFVIQDLFASPNLPPEAVAQLTGMVCFYGNHYVAFHFSRTAKKWVRFDDSDVAEVGDFTQVRAKCKAAKYKPTLLFFEV